MQSSAKRASPDATVEVSGFFLCSNCSLRGWRGSIEAGNLESVGDCMCRIWETPLLAQAASMLVLALAIIDALYHDWRARHH